jgi:phage terminase large subunit
MTDFELAAKKIAFWRKDILLFVRENFQVEPDAWQVQFLRAWASDKPKHRIAMQACAGPGKSAALAWAGWWTLLCKAQPGKHPNGAAVSMSGDNLRDGLWKELAVWHGRSAVLQATFEWTQTRIFAKQHPATWWLSARTFAKSADAEAQGRALSGLHAPVMFYLVDESGSVPVAVGRTAEQGMSNCEWGRIAQAGNPTTHDGMLYDASSDPSIEVIRITGDPDDKDRSPRIDIEWARAQIRKHGRDNPWVMAFILGKFPPTAINALLSPDEVRTAIDRRYADGEYAHIQKRIGIDVARFGDDATVLFPRQGLRAFMPVVMRNAKGPDIAARLLTGKQRFGSELEFIDSTGGYSATVEDSYELAGENLIGVGFAEKADDPRYANKRAEIYFRGSQWVKERGWLPNLPVLIKEACAAKYFLNKRGQLQIIEKDQIKLDLHGHSPDHWEALLTTFAIPDAPTSIESLLPGFTKTARGKRGAILSEWDPYGGELAGVS